MRPWSSSVSSYSAWRRASCFLEHSDYLRMESTVVNGLQLLIVVTYRQRQDHRQGRACPGAHPRPPGFRRQNLDAHPPGPRKKTKWAPNRPLGKCLSNSPTHPAHRKKTKFGVGAQSPLKRHPVARSRVGSEAGVQTSGGCRWPLRHFFVIPGDRSVVCVFMYLLQIELS